MIKYPEWFAKSYESNANKRYKLLKETVVSSWSQEFELPRDYKFYQHYAYIPQLAPGHYMLMASPTKDFTTKGFIVRNFTVSAGAFVLMSQADDSVQGYVVDYVTGEPVARQKVQLQRTKDYYDMKWTTAATVATDAQGFFSVYKAKDRIANFRDTINHRYSKALIDYAVKDRNQLFQDIVEKIQEKYPTYNICPTLDADASDF